MELKKVILAGSAPLGIMVLILLTFVYLVNHIPLQQEQVQQELEEIGEPISLSFVSGTEYKYGDAGQVIVEARDKNGSAVQTNCTVDVWYPDKMVFIANVSTNTSASGNSFIDFIVPNVKGVYEYQANCTVHNKQMVVSKSFHVSYPKISAEAIK